MRIDGFAPGTSTAIFEDVLVTANNQGTGVITCTRGQDQSDGQAFAAGATLTPIFSAKMINDAFARIDNATLMTKIDDILVGTDSRYPAASGQITFLNNSGSGTNLLPTTYRHLLIEWYARGDTAAAAAGMLLRFNNIATATYDNQHYLANAGSNAPAENLAATAIDLGNCPANTATANYFGTGEAKIRHYQGTVGNKLANVQSGWSMADTTTNTQVYINTGKWRTVGTAITRLDILPSAGNFVVGSLFTLWGVP